MRRVAILIPLVVVAFAFGACGGDDGSGSDGAPDPAALEGKSWILAQMLAEGGQTQIVGVVVSASFDGTTISGSSGCNSYQASYEASGNEISFGPIAGTQMACPEAESSTEARYLQLLQGVATFDTSGRDVDVRRGRDGGPAVHAGLIVTPAPPEGP